eukprot:NODE_2960_length_1056_cov_20.024758_g2824_i0.p1 GENE.NODE_2960_length_1056_cov_20.024758_g2824_i0~~NODE_2960_length_1056_cov_20.024758_g2824_i0.p1  ORF type:complete len:329 (+),score=82.63 NODE_2960_length_1056_cov_20.024758_g2824_i0:45-989(+)
MDQLSLTDRALHAWRTVPETARRLVLALCGGWVLSTLSPGLLHTCALTPILLLHLHLWTLCTYPWVDGSLLSTLTNAVALAAIARFVEPVWGSREFLKFIGILSVAGGLVTCLISYVLAVTSKNWLADYYCGFQGIVAGFCVVLKQLLPDQEIRVWFIPVRLKSLPMLVVGVSFFADFFLGTPSRFVELETDETGASSLISVPQRSSSSLLIGTSVGIAWVYLRYFQNYISATSEAGDPSDSFAFHTLFPEPCHPLAQRLAGHAYSIFHHWLPAQSPPPPVGTTLGGHVSNDSPRHTAALAALERASHSHPETV